MQQQYHLDINQARKGYMPQYQGCFNAGLVKPQDSIQGGHFAAYSPAYISSNEQVSQIVHWLKPKNKTVLAVAGSGDVPLFLSAYGAGRIDTFDISYNARVIMDVKTYMLTHKYNLFDYTTTLRSLKRSADLLHCRATETLRNSASSQTWDYIQGMHGCKIFLHSENGDIETMPTQFEFENMQQKTPERYNFIWSDLFSLGGQISGQKYDIIYLSNVLQYVDDTQHIVNVLQDLHPHLNPNGVIVLDSLLLNTTVSRMNKYDQVAKQIKDWADKIYVNSAKAIFLQTK